MSHSAIISPHFICMHEPATDSTWATCQGVRSQRSFDADGWLYRQSVREALLAERSRSERGRRAMFTVLSGKSPCVNPNIDVGWYNLRPLRHASLVFAWSWWLTPRREVRGCDGEGGALWRGYQGLNKETLSALGFRVCCETRNQKVFLVFFLESVFALSLSINYFVR